MIEISFTKKLQSATGAFELGLDLTLQPGHFLGVYGPSGAGKSTLLRIIAGLAAAEQGKVVINDKVWLDTQAHIQLPPQKRSLGYLAQDPALFPHMTVKENLLFALDKQQDKRIIEELIEAMEIGNLRKQKPNSLSGGQQQRVALARALVQQPDVLLLDEPFTGLDRALKQKMVDLLKTIHQTYQPTILLVSHGFRGLLQLSSQILKIEGGQAKLYQDPLQAFSAAIDESRQARVLFRREDSGKFEVGCLVGGQLITIPVDAEKWKTLSVGDAVTISGSFQLD